MMQYIDQYDCSKRDYFDNTTCEESVLYILVSKALVWYFDIYVKCKISNKSIVIAICFSSLFV